MTKLRVHELAKELGMENKELMDVLAKKHVEVKSHMSSLSDEVVEELRGARAGKTGAGAEDAPKKKNIVQVFRPQNSKMDRMDRGQHVLNVRQEEETDSVRHPVPTDLVRTVR